MDAIENIISESVFPNKTEYRGEYVQGFGLTKREHFAALAMQGMISSLPASSPENLLEAPKNVALWSLMFADALIAALNKEVPGE